MKDSGERKVRLSGEERRRQIIAAALDLFAEKGFSGTRTREIAERAGISETLIFQHFKTKEALCRAAFTEFVSHHPFIPEIQKGLEEKDDIAVFKTLALHLTKHARQDPRIMRLFLYGALEGFRLRPEKETYPNLAEFLGDYIQRRIEDGVFKKVNSRLAARLFLESILMYLLDQRITVTGPPLPFTAEEAVDTLVAIFIDGLKNS